jgi:hypothetical protein
MKKCELMLQVNTPESVDQLTHHIRCLLEVLAERDMATPSQKKGGAASKELVAGGEGSDELQQVAEVAVSLLVPAAARHQLDVTCLLDSLLRVTKQFPQVV